MTPATLARWQARMGLTQQQAADALGVSRSTYMEWLRGTSRTRGNPVTIDRRTALACKALEWLPTEWLDD